MPDKPTRTQFSALAQICAWIPPFLVAKLARQHGVDAKARGFSPWSHVVALLYAQLVHAISLNDVCDGLRLHAAKLWRLRGAAPPSRNGLSHASKVRSAAMAEEAVATAWIELARSKGRFDEAIRIARKWQRYTEGVGAVRSNVRWTAMIASLRHQEGEPELAMRSLRRAVKLGAGGQYRAAFLAELDFLREPLARLTDSDLEEAEREFVASLLRKGKTPAEASTGFDFAFPDGTLSSREAALLKLLAKGQTNREIGSTLGLTEGTVKWYLHRIYDKLGIRRRSQAAMLVAQWQTQRHSKGDQPHPAV